MLSLSLVRVYKHCDDINLLKWPSLDPSTWVAAVPLTGGRGTQQSHFTLGPRCAELFNACKISNISRGWPQESPCTIYSIYGPNFLYLPWAPTISSQWPWVSASQKKGMDLVYRYAVYALYLMWINFSCTRPTCSIDKYITHSEPCSSIHSSFSASFTCCHLPSTSWVN